MSLLSSLLGQSVSSVSTSTLSQSTSSTTSTTSTNSSLNNGDPIQVYENQRKIVELALKKLNCKTGEVGHLTLRQLIWKDLTTNPQNYSSPETSIPQLLGSRDVIILKAQNLEDTHTKTIVFIAKQNLCMDVTINELMTSAVPSELDHFQDTLSLILKSLEFYTTKLTGIKQITHVMCRNIEKAKKTGKQELANEFNEKNRKKGVITSPGKIQLDYEKDINSLSMLLRSFHTNLEKYSILIEYLKKAEKNITHHSNNKIKTIEAYHSLNKTKQMLSLFHNKLSSIIEKIRNSPTFTAQHKIKEFESAFIQLGELSKLLKTLTNESNNPIIEDSLIPLTMPTINNSLMPQTPLSIKSEKHNQNHFMLGSENSRQVINHLAQDFVTEYASSLTEFEEGFGKFLQVSADYLTNTLTTLEAVLTKESEAVNATWILEKHPLKDKHKVKPLKIGPRPSKAQNQEQTSSSDEELSRSPENSNSSSSSSSSEDLPNEVMHPRNTMSSSPVSQIDPEHIANQELIKKMHPGNRLDQRETVQAFIKTNAVMTRMLKKKIKETSVLSPFKGDLLKKYLSEIKSHSVQIGLGYTMLVQAIEMGNADWIKTIIPMMILDLSVQIEQLISINNLIENNELQAQHSLCSKATSSGLLSKLSPETKKYLETMDQAIIWSRYPWSSFGAENRLSDLLKATREDSSSSHEGMTNKLNLMNSLLKQHLSSMSEIAGVLQPQQTSKAHKDLTNSLIEYIDYNQTGINSQRSASQKGVKKNEHVIPNQFSWIKKERTTIENHAKEIAQMEKEVAEFDTIQLKKGLPHLRDVKEHLNRLSVTLELIEKFGSDPFYHAWLYRNCMTWQFAFEKSYQAQEVLEYRFTPYQHDLSGYLHQMEISDENEVSKFCFNRGIQYSELTKNTKSDTQDTACLRRMQKASRILSHQTNGFQVVGQKQVNQNSADVLNEMRTFMQMGNELMKKRISKLQNSFQAAKSEYSFF